MTEPEQWVVELWEQGTRAWKKASGSDDPDRAAALTIQRAFEERERELREALEPFSRGHLADVTLKDYQRARQALATHQDAPVTENSHDQ